MGAGDTTSGTPADWSSLFHANLNRPSAMFDSTVITTTTTMSSTTIAIGASPASSSTAASQPTIEGRVGKSSRRRSRASRRAPTTLLNTDTANFRAMVQQFTGIPSAPYPATYQQPNISFGVQQTTMMPFGHQTHHLRQQQQQQYQVHQFQQQQQYQQSQQQQESMFAVGNSNNNNNSDVFLSPGGNVEVSEGFFMDGMAGSSESRAGGYLL